MNRVLVTGASGFVGRHVIAPLLARGFEVHTVARRPLSGLEAHRHAIDLLEPEAPDRILTAVRPTHLLHLAWYTVHREFWTSVENLRWVEASLRLLRRFHELGGRRAVLAGTSAEYDWSGGICVERRTPLAPQALYGAAKNGLREVATAYAGTVGLELAWGRIFFLYGPHEHPERLVASVARALLRGERAPVSGGSQRRDYLYVEEAAAAFAALLDSEIVGPVNIGSGTAPTVRAIVETIAAGIGRPELVELGRRGPDDRAPLVVADVRRLRDELGWSPAVALEDGIARTIDWWRAAEAAAGSATVKARER
ncbi:MAG: NAD-dependent epimerase/dehydratase family protein [Gaiellaceae bacterium]